MDRLTESFQQQLTVEGIFYMVVNLAIILAIFHYLIFPMAREIKKDMNPEGKTVTAVTFENGDRQTITTDYATD